MEPSLDGTFEKPTGTTLAQALRSCLSMNRISVVADTSISAQALTYAEYRMFATLTRQTPDFHRARVVLRSRDVAESCDHVSCSLTVGLEPSASLRIRTTGPHVYAAINRAVERLGDALGGRLDQRRTS
jgi:ribosome-associated translation inhibitor RaiA